MTRTLLIDADSIVWTAAWKNKDKPDEAMLYALDTFLASMFDKLKVDCYVGVLKNPSTVEFRRAMFSTYKSTRPPAPCWFTDRRSVIVEHLLSKWKFVLTEKGYETDDAIASIHYNLTNSGLTANTMEPIICSIDKDLKQIPGIHYNPSTSNLIEITEYEARYNMLKQLLTGDVVDNIKGVRGIGPVKADKLLHERVLNPVYGIMDAYRDVNPTIYHALIDFAENVLQVVMKRDFDYPYILVHYLRQDVQNIDKLFES